MTSTSPERYSHKPENRSAVPLSQHLEDVANRVDYLIPEQVTSTEGTLLGPLVRRTALVHDFGKLTRWFQQHLDDDHPDGPTHHAPLGGLLAYHVLDVTGYDGENLLLGYCIVETHHGTLGDVGEYVYDRMKGDRQFENRQSEIERQVDDIDTHVPELAESMVSDATDGNGGWQEFRDRLLDGDLFESILDHVGAGEHNLHHKTHPVSDGFYASYLQAWSALVLADKTSAARASRRDDADEPLYEPTHPAIDALVSRVEQLQAGVKQQPSRERRLNELRERARKEATGAVPMFVESESDVATLTLPTGLGKTITGLNVALKLREEFDGDRIVYTLPFTSIIDQVVTECREIFNADRPGLLTSHHHLADTVKNLADGDVADDQRAGLEGMLGESWRAGVVVTTFVQLFESLAGPTNGQSMKLPALYDSVIILDEPQSLPHEWWALVRRLVGILTDKYGATIVAMTATQPGLFGEESFELVEDHERYFTEIERVEYELHESVIGFPDPEAAMQHEEAAAVLLESIRSGSSTLAVCNTIDSARELTEMVQNRAPNAISVGNVYQDAIRTKDELLSGEELADQTAARADGIATLHLTTRIRPRDRRRFIDAAKELAERDVPLLTVSTQLIEAGVDISFARVFRDFAPMDSVVQAAGRCNRSFERETGKVTVWWLNSATDSELTPGQAVYDRWGDSLLSETSNAIDVIRDGRTSLSESEVAERAVRRYYDELSSRDPGNRKWVTKVDDCQFDQLGTYSLIDTRRAVDVVVCRTDAERTLVQDARDAWDQFEFETVDEYVDRMRSWRVSIPIYDDEAKTAVGEVPYLHPETDLRVLDAQKTRIDPYFDAETGVELSEPSTGARFL